MVAKRAVEVAEVVVALIAVKFCKVEEAVVMIPPSLLILKSSVPALFTKLKNFPTKLGVEEALIKVPVVPVAFTWNKALRSSEAVVVAPTTNDLYVEDVAERKSPAATRARAWPKEAPEASEPSQREALPVIVVQKSESAVPVVPKIESVPPPIAKLVVLAVVAKKAVEVALVVVALVVMVSVRPLRVVRLLRVVVAMRFVSKRVSKRPLKVEV